MPQARVASIKEVSSDSDNDNDNYDHNDINEGASLAVRTAKLSNNEKEAWLNEMRQMGINF